MSIKSFVLAGALASAAALAAATAPALAAGEESTAPRHPEPVEGSWEGIFGTFDQAQLQRGYQVYEQVCATCHSMRYVHYRDLTSPYGPGYTPDQAKAIAAQHTVVDLDDAGEEVERPAQLTDHLVSPYPNDAAAKAAFGGALPPDLSLITRARTAYHGTVNQFFNGTGAPSYVYSLMIGYEEEPPEDFDLGELNYNPYFKGHKIAMPAPLFEGAVEYAAPEADAEGEGGHGAHYEAPEATIDQMARDVTAFLVWAAEPHMVERKQMGFKVIVFLAIFAGLLYCSYRKLWADVKH